MKRNTKPFSVEIKKSRVQGQIHHLPPRRLFEPTPVEPSEIVQKESSRAMARSARAPRILPSIVGPVWNSAELVEPIRRAPSSKQDNRREMELDLSAAPFEAQAEAQSAVLTVAEAVSEADMAAAGGDATPVHEAHPVQGDSPKKARKPRKRDPEVVEQLMQPEPLSRPERLPEPVIPEVSMLPSSEAIQHRRTKRLAEAAQLPRAERWKRRLHPAFR